ncbi:MAG: gamma-glutamyl-gamma-aminobutyrate hydrolase family protein [Acidobacteria bacterium]|nr:gamma-glutamyl-gamma-aminobutyrate hydrolase family protein [Acidobacteriota bacterium]
MRIRVFRHVPFEHLGLIEPALRSRGFEIEYVDLYRDALPPGKADALIFMGGPMSANDDLPWLRREIGLIEEAAAGGTPVLGVCLGAQLIARALGARVYRNPVKEIGWYPIYWTPAADADRLFHDLEQPEMLFHWHGETFDVPAGAEWLAWSDACRNQAFRYGESVYGLQFHLEVTAEMIGDWCGQEANQEDVRWLAAPLDAGAHASRLAAAAEIVFGRWCGVVDSCQHSNSA